MTWLITEFYKKGTEKEMEETRTLAIQVSEELFERLDKYVKAHKLKKRTFLIDLITRALEEAEEDEGSAAEPSDEDGDTADADKDSSEDADATEDAEDADEDTEDE